MGWMDYQHLKQRNWWKQWFPGPTALLSYNLRQHLIADCIAGLTVGVMAIPLTVSFASMAGLPAAFGLYGCIAPIIGYFLCGGSPFLSVGPVALVSLLLNDSLSKLFPESHENVNPNMPANPQAQNTFNRAAIQVSLLAGLLYGVISLARLGFLCNLLSRPIIGAFLTAGSIVISLSQAKYIVGYYVPRGNKLHVVLYNLAKGITGFRWQEFMMGLTWIGLQFAVKNSHRLHRSLKYLSCLGVVFVATLSIALVWAADLQHNAGIQVVGSIKRGLPGPTLTWWLPMYQPIGLLTTAVVIVLVSLLEAISIAKALGEKHGGRIDPSTEVRGLAAANILGALFNAYPSTGSFARSAISAEAGAKSSLNALIAGGVVACVLLFMTRVFEHMPMNAMAAIVIVGVIPLLDFQRAVFYFKASKLDFLTWLVTFLVCLFVGIDTGLACGIISGLIATFARLARLTSQPQETGLNGADNYNGDETEDGLLVSKKGSRIQLHVQGPLCFANIQQIEFELQTLLEERGKQPEADKPAQGISAKLGTGNSIEAESLVQEQKDQDSPMEEEGSLDIESRVADEPASHQGLNIVLDLTRAGFVDITAVEILKDLTKCMQQNGHSLSLVHVSPAVLDSLTAAGLIELLGSTPFLYQ